MSDPHREDREAVGKETADPLIGRLIGSYQVTKLLGAGGMGAVYLGQHPSIGSKVAIKLLHPRFADDKGIVDRFFNEARAVNLIGHDNIIKVLDFDVTADHRHYFVMEFLSGRPLQAILAGRQLPLAVAGPIFVQCCRALQAAHAHGIVHRDLKPDNIFLTRQGEREHFVKLLDFGIAKLSEPGASGSTQTGVVMGTPAYMSPEQAAGEVHEIGPRSDVYSLGVILYEAATGRAPFGGAGVSMRQVLMGHLCQEPPPPRELAPEVGKDYERVILRCLAKEPAARFQSMAELQQAIEGCLKREGHSTDLPSPAEVAWLEKEDGAPPPSARPSSPRATDPRRATSPAAKQPAARTKTSHAPQASRKWIVVAALAALPIAAGGVYLALREPADEIEAPARKVVMVRREEAPARSAPAEAELPRQQILPPPVRGEAESAKPAPPQRPRAEAKRERGSPAKREREQRVASAEVVPEKAIAPPAQVPPAAEPKKDAPPPPAEPPLAKAQPPPEPAPVIEPVAPTESAEEKPAAPIEHVRLFLVSRPPKSAVEARWEGGSATATTPSALEVPKGAKVKLVFTHAGYVAESRELTAASAQAVTATLSKRN